MTAELTITMVPIGDLVPTPDNKRKIDPKDPAMRDLAASIKGQGILEPLLARPHPEKKGKLDLRAGARRLAAAKVAGLAMVPVIVREMSDDAALDVTVVENLQREDLDPMDEAASIKLLIERGRDARAIAGQLGRSPEWVMRRAALGNLAPHWRKRHANLNDPVSHWTAGHLELIARLPAEDQVAIDGSYTVEKPNEPAVPSSPQFDDPDMTVADVAKEIKDWLRKLRRAPWDLADAELYPIAGPCGGCSKRSCATPGLFEDYELPPAEIAKHDRCLDRRCWDAKLAKHVGILRAQAEQTAKPVLLRLNSRATEAPPSLRSLARCDQSFEECKKGETGAVPAVRVEGPDAGRIIYGKFLKQPHYGGGGGQAKPGPKKELGEALAKLSRERWGRAFDLARKATKKVARKDLALPKGAKDPDLFVVGMAMCDSYMGLNRQIKNGVEASRAKVADLADAVWPGLANDLANQNLHGGTSGDDFKAARSTAELFGIDLDALKAEADKALPESKEIQALRDKAQSTKGAKKKDKQAKPAGKGAGDGKRDADAEEEADAGGEDDEG